MTVLRPYQREAIDAVHAYWDQGGGNPLIELATGTGKSVVHGQLIREIAEPNPSVNVLCLTHVRELVQQNVQAALRVWPECPVGINAASLGRRDRRARVLFAAIQSVHREDAFSLGKRHLILVDEAHLIPRDGAGMYRKLIERMREAEPDLRVVGLTATPFRMDSGRLDDGDERLFDDTVYTYGIADGVRDGYLSALVSRAGAAEIDVSNVQRRGGEFVAGALEAAARPIVRDACLDMVSRLRDRRSWLVFCAGVQHAQEVQNELHALGIASACVTGDTPANERAAIIRDFKAGRIRALTNANVLTTGFDAPATDAIAMLRPTLSTGLYIQMLGRGTRLAEGKTNCLVLDYAGNVRRHGPVDAIEVRGARGRGESSEKTTIDSVRAKVCPQCQSMHALQAVECADCGFEFPKPEIKHQREPDREAAVMVREVEAEWIKVTAIEAHVHGARVEGKQDTLRVEYWNGISCHREWVCLDHPVGFARAKAEAWWKCMTRQTSADGVSVASAAEEIREGEAMVDCVAIRVKRDGQYWRVAERKRADGTIVDDKFRIHRHVEDERNAA